MRPEQARAVRETPDEVTPDIIASMWRLFASDHDARAKAAVRVLREISYGQHSRQQLSLHMPSGTVGAGLEVDGLRPVLVFLPGGGFVAGNRHTPGTPYYDHVGRWAVEHGMIGATVDYRLAPDHPWPAGATDAASAILHLRDRVAEHGGDPEQIIVVGHSAGAAHVAGLLAGHGGPVPPGIVGAAFLSGLYDLEDAETDPLMSAYFGRDPAEYSDRTPLPGLLETDVPLLLAFAELDPALFHAHVARFVAAYHLRHGRVPTVTCATGHNHISEIVSLGLDDDPLGEALRLFVSTVTERGTEQEAGLARAASTHRPLRNRESPAHARSIPGSRR